MKEVKSRFICSSNFKTHVAEIDKYNTGIGTPRTATALPRATSCGVPLKSKRDADDNVAKSTWRHHHNVQTEMSRSIIPTIISY